MKSYTSEQLKEAARSVSYEAKHLWYAYDAYARYKGSFAEPNLGTLTFEAFLIHYRNLREFLSEPAERDDVKAKQYCAAWAQAAWPDHVGDARRFSDERYSERGLIDKLLAYLTHFREEVREASPPVKDWPVQEMFHTAKTKFLSFVGQLDAAVAPWFSEAEAVLRHSDGPGFVVGKESHSTFS